MAACDGGYIPILGRHLLAGALDFDLQISPGERNPLIE